MMGEMGGEIEGEHGGSRAPFYPSLMNLPSLTPEQRAQLDDTARPRMYAGTGLMSRGVDRLSKSSELDSMREGTRLIREGLVQFQVVWKPARRSPLEFRPAQLPCNGLESKQI
jgi:hypothetical protein